MNKVLILMLIGLKQARFDLVVLLMSISQGRLDLVSQVLKILHMIEFSFTQTLQQEIDSLVIHQKLLPILTKHGTLRKAISFILSDFPDSDHPTLQEGSHAGFPILVI